MFKKVVVEALLLVLLEQCIRSGANHAGRLSPAMWHAPLEQQCQHSLEKENDRGLVCRKGLFNEWDCRNDLASVACT